MIFKLLKNIFKQKKYSKNILIISFKFLGDTIFTFPAIQALTERYPDYYFILLCSESNKTLYEIQFENFQYIIIDREKIGLMNFKFPLVFFKICFQVRKYTPQITIDFTSSIKSAIIAVMSGGQKLIGFGNARLKVFFDLFEANNRNSNMIKMFLSPIERLVETKISPVYYEYTLKNIRIRSILMHPFAGWKAKEWGLRKFIKIGEMLAENYEVVIISEKNNISPDILDEIKNSSIIYKTTQSLVELIGEIKKCDFFIGNDSGPLLISNLLRKPVFALFGPTNPEFHPPVTNMWYKHIEGKLLCSPKIGQKLCFTFGGRNGCPSYECMNHLTVEKVYSSIMKFISEIS